MQDLTLVGLTGDKRKLILVSDSGEEYSLPADAKLRSALRGDQAPLGAMDEQLEIQMESALRPRDIQARIRAGESPETVAAAAQTTVDKIMAFAMPVLAERAHIADRAQRSSVRRKAGDGPARLLGDAVAERLRGRNVDPDSVEWDAWRREDGRWTLVADYRSGESTRHAEFSFDAPGRYVVAEDDEARWLVGEQSTRKGPQPRAGGAPRRLSAVSSEDELPLGEDVIGMVNDSPTSDAAPSADEVGADEHTMDLSEAASSVRDRAAEDPAARAGDPGDLGAETGDADWIPSAPAERGAAEKAGREESARAAGATQRTGPGSTEPQSEASEAGAGDKSQDPDGRAPAPEAQASEPEGAPEPEGEAPEPAAKKPSRKGRRASVPSWDEIMFGGGRSE